jgi:hypothetical protein
MCARGVIHVNSVGARQATPEVILLSIDCKQKYPEIIAMSCCCDENGKHTSGVLIGVSERTLGADLAVLEDANDLDLTEVEIEHDKDYTVSFAEGGLYSISLVLIKPSDNIAFDNLGWNAR